MTFNEPQTVPCKACGEPTTMLGTKFCDSCWAVDRGLAQFLKTAGGRALVQSALDERLKAAYPDQS